MSNTIYIPVSKFSIFFNLVCLLSEQEHYQLANYKMAKYNYGVILTTLFFLAALATGLAFLTKALIANINNNPTKIFGPNYPKDGDKYRYIKCAQRISDSKWQVIWTTYHGNNVFDQPFAVTYNPTNGNNASSTLFDTKSMAYDYLTTKYIADPVNKAYEYHTDAANTIYKTIQ